MATLKVNRSDLFPVGTSVGAYLSGARLHNGKPSGSAVETHVVAADGSLTFTALAEGVAYQLYAEVEGSPRYLRVEGPRPAAVGKPQLSERLRKARVAVAG